MLFRKSELEFIHRTNPYRVPQHYRVRNRSRNQFMADQNSQNNILEFRFKLLELASGCDSYCLTQIFFSSPSGAGNRHKHGYRKIFEMIRTHINFCFVIKFITNDVIVG